MRKGSIFVLVSLSVILLAAVVYAGEGYSFLCLNKDCGFKTDVTFGPFMLSDLITGYCVQCKEFVNLRWDRGDKEPAPVARIWNPSTGETLNLYACPKCAKPFLPINDIKDITHCPRCGKNAIKTTLEVIKD